MSHILGAGTFFKNDKQQERLLLMGDSRLLIVAGSDTTATTLVYTFYNLAKNPSLADKIRAELKEKNIQNNSDLSVSALQYCDYLNGVINETLRLHPPVPGGVYRNTPKEGVVIDGKQLPGGVKTIGPHYTIQRCKSSPPNLTTAPTNAVSPQHRKHSSAPTNSSQSAGPQSPTSSSTRTPSSPSQSASSPASASNLRSRSCGSC